MPTTNPRVNVTLSPTLDALLFDMAKYQRVSKSQVLRELLEAAEPALQQAVALMEAASKASESVRRDVKDGLERSQGLLQADFDRTMSLLSTRDLVSEAQAIRGKRPARKAEPSQAAPPPQTAQNPPPSNRGVKSAKQIALIPPKTALARGKK